MDLADPPPEPTFDAIASEVSPAVPHADPLFGHAHAAAHLRLPIHVNARGLALGIIATIAFVYALQWSKNFLVPLLLGILLAYTLNPLVSYLERLRIHRVIGATLVTVAMLGLMAGVMLRVKGEFLNIIDDVPKVTQKVTKIMSNKGGPPSTIQKVQAAAAQIDAATASVGNGESRSSRKRTANNGDDSKRFKVMDWILAGSMGLIDFITQATMVVFLVFFLLLAGDTFKRKLVKLTGPSLSRKKVTVHILDDINTSIQKYMFMLLVTNVLLASLMWVALSAIGLENAGAWAIMAGLLHLMPYFGPLLTTALISLAAFVQFESLQMVIFVSGVSLAIATLVGTVIATWMTGRIAKMNAAAVFVSLLFWGWLWGIWGLLLGVPVVVMIKVVAERIEGMDVLAELLGE